MKRVGIYNITVQREKELHIHVKNLNMATEKCFNEVENVHVDRQKCLDYT